MAADLVIKNGWVVTPTETFKGGVAISGERSLRLARMTNCFKAKEIDAKGKHILPGIIDGHVHFRTRHDPQEDFTTGSTAAVCGGITSVVDMPNTVPPTADAEQVKVKQQLGRQSRWSILVSPASWSKPAQRHFADGRGRRHRLQDLLWRNHRQPALPRRWHVHGGLRLHRPVEVAVGNPRREPPDHGLLYQQT